MIVVAVNRVAVLTSHNLTPRETPKAEPGSALYLLWVCSASAFGLLRVKSGSLSRLKVDREWTQKADLGFGLGLLSLRVCLVSTVGSRVKEA